MRSRGREDESTPLASDGPEPLWIDATNDPTISPISAGSSSAGPAVVLAGILSILGLAIALLAWTGSVDVAPVEEEPVAPSTSSPPRPATPDTDTAAPTTTTTTLPAPPQLASAPPTWLDGLLLSFVDEQEELHLYDLPSGASVVGKQWATFAWPPLPQIARIVGAPNRSFAIDPTSPEDSGRISTTVHTVRLAPADDIFGFFSSTDDGYEFFAGSQWGPAQNGLIEASSRAAVFAVPGKGIVVSEPDATGVLVTADGVREIPSRLGRIVDATDTHLLGVHCDDFGRCVGRLADWDAGGERIIPAEIASMQTVAIAPDGLRVLAADATSWGIWDLDGGTFVSGDGRTVPDREVAWTDDGARLFWVDRGAVVAVEPGAPEEAFTVAVDDLSAADRVADGADLVVVSLFSGG